MSENILLKHSMPSTLLLDPFFDNIRGQGRGLGRVQDECSTPDPTRYHDPATQRTSIDGSVLSSRMPTGRWGARGVVIPRATRNGRSQGWDPQNPPHRRVIIDPIVTGGALDVDLSLITKSIAQAAVRASQELVPDTSNIESERLRMAAYFHIAAEEFGVGRALNTPEAVRGAGQLGSAPGATTAPTPLHAMVKQAETAAPPPSPVAAPYQSPPRPQPRPPVQPRPEIYAAQFGAPAPPPQPRVTPPYDPCPAQAPAQPSESSWTESGQIDHGTGRGDGRGYQAPVDYEASRPTDVWEEQRKSQPERHFHTARLPSQPHRPVNMLSSFASGAAPSRSVASEPRAAERGAQPRCHVIFDMPHGEYDSYFHDVVRQGATLVLVYDTTFQGGGRFFPKALDQPFAVYVEGAPTVFLVESTDISYTYDGRMHYVLLIVKESPVDPNQ